MALPCEMILIKDIVLMLKCHGSGSGICLFSLNDMPIDITLLTRVRIVKGMVFPVVMYRYESWTIRVRALKNWCFRIVVLEKTLESPLESKEIKPVNLKRNQPWILGGMTNAEAEAPVIIWLFDKKSWLIGKDPDSGKDWGQEEKRATKSEMVGWHYRFNGHELGQTLGGG